MTNDLARITRSTLFAAALRQGLALGSPSPIGRDGQVKVLLGSLGLPAAADGSLVLPVQGRLLELQRRGAILLARLDMVSLVRADLVIASEVCEQAVTEQAVTQSCWHFLLAPGAAGSAPRRF